MPSKWRGRSRPRSASSATRRRSRRRNGGSPAAAIKGSNPLMPAILAIDNYDSFTFILVDYLRSLGATVAVEKNDTVSVSDALRAPYDGYLISPGPGTPEEAGISIDLSKACIEERRPLLGICLGHQAIGLACGATVER